MTLLDGGTALAHATLVDGQAVLKVSARTLGVGSHTLVVSYPGDATYDRSSDVVVVKVVKGK